MKLFMILFGCLWSSIATAQVIPQGEYNADGYGLLKVGKSINGKSAFSLFALGANGHMCEVEGDIQKGKFIDSQEDKNKVACQIDFTYSKRGVDLSVGDPYLDACRGYCGARAWFTGVYFRAPKICTQNVIYARQKKGQLAYRQKKHTQAQSDLAFILKHCGSFIDWRWEGSVRNDLALVEAKRGNKAGCRAALKPYKEDLNLSDDAVGGEGYGAPIDHDGYLDIIKAARVNAKLCERIK